MWEKFLPFAVRVEAPKPGGRRLCMGTIPGSLATEPAETAGVLLDSPMDKKLRILVADPYKDTVDSYCLLINLWGHRVLSARDGQAALDAAMSFAPDVVLMELALPGLDGCAVARRLAESFAPRVPLLVAITGHGADIDRRRAHAAGFRYYFLKPVDLDVLRTLLMSEWIRVNARPLGRTHRFPLPGRATRRQFARAGEHPPSVPALDDYLRSTTAGPS
jgi:CheY-like chemotaxis protein